MNKSRLRKIASTDDQHFIEILKHSFLAMVLLGVGTLIQFVFDLSLTHTFKAQGSGIFYLCFSILSALALIGRLGMDRAVVRFIPPLLKNKPDEAAGVQKTTSHISLAITLPLMALFFFLAPFIADNIFHSSELTPYFRIFALAIPPLALNYVYSGVLRALKRTRSAISIERLSMYAFGIIAVISLGHWYGLQGASIGFVIGIYLTMFEGIWYLHKDMPAHDKPVPFDKKLLIKVSVPLLFVVFAAQMIGQVSVIMLGAMSTSTDVSIFNIALRVSMLLNLILIGINIIVATKISELYAEGKHDELETMISKVSALSFVSSVPVFIILIVFSNFWLGLFGSAFTAGATTLFVLSIGQLFNVATGSNNFVLAMTGHEKALAVAVGTSLIINIVAGFIFIPAYDALGAGIATSLAMISSNLIMVFMVKSYLGIWSLPFRYIKIWFKSLKKAF